jgi:hypothetical protein
MVLWAGSAVLVILGMVLGAMMMILKSESPVVQKPPEKPPAAASPAAASPTAAAPEPKNPVAKDNEEDLTIPELTALNPGNKSKPPGKPSAKPTGDSGKPGKPVEVASIPHLRPTLSALTVEGLRASAGHGAVMSIGTGREDVLAQNRGTSGIRWAVITGLIPAQKQADAASDAYRETLPPFDPARDIPQIAWYQLERAEVGATADLDHLKWTAVSVKKALGFYGEFRGFQREVVSDNYIYNPSAKYPLVFPSPPMGDEYVWGDELVHVPEIPRMANREKDLMRPRPRLIRKATEPEGNGPDVPDVPPDGNGTEEGPNPPGAGGPPAPPKAGSQSAGPMGGGPKTSEANAAGGWDRDQPSPVRLFRFFDFTVQPGKRYRYRVQLWWTNPNRAIPRQYLVNPDDSKEPYVKTEWSVPSEPVGVPRDTRILAGEVNKKHLEQCKVGIAYFDVTSGFEAFETLEVERGQWLNFYGKTLHNPRSGLAGPMPAGPVAPGGSHGKPGTHRSSMGNELARLMGPGGSQKRPGTHGPAPRPPTRVRPEAVPAAGTVLSEVKVDYLTDTLLLDISGGARIPGRDVGLREPGHVLLLDPQGNLVVLHELADEDEIKNPSAGPDARGQPR